MPIPLPPDAERVFHGLFVDAYHWQQTLYDGTQTTFECLVRHDSVSVLAFIDADTIVLTHQQQPGRELAFWDVPGGRVDAGEDHQRAVQRELIEETGYQAGQLLLWTTNRWQGITRYEELLYVGSELVLSHAPSHTDAGEKITLVQTPWAKAVDMALTGQLRSPQAALAILGIEYDPAQRQRLKTFLSPAQI